MVGRAGPALAVLALALAALAAACGGGGGGESAAPVTPVAPTDGVLNVRAFEWGFEPTALLLTQDETVTIQLQNDGRVLHNFKVADMPADVLVSDSTGPLSADEGEVFVGAEGGVLGIMELVPLEAGTYTFYCTIAGHRELGMEGTLTVESAP
jgi:uncharacterized cupredoxin-like copper-binding protein